MHDTVFSKEIIRVIKDKRRGVSKGAKVMAAHVCLSPLSHVTARSLSEAFQQMIDKVFADEKDFLASRDARPGQDEA